MKRILALVLCVLLLAGTLAGCSDTVTVMDGTVSMLDDAYQEYLKDHEKLPDSVLDTLDFMLENYVSGTATPPIDDIDSTDVDPDDDDGKKIVDESSGVVKNEKQLRELFHQSIKKLEKGTTFEVEGNWLTEEVLYDVFFRQVHDEYMIDAFGIYSYSFWVTQNSRSNNVYKMEYGYLDDMPTEKIAKMRKQLTEKGQEVVAKLNLEGKSDYEKIYAINEYLCDTIYYPEEPFISMDFTPYGGLIDGRCVCDGYARSTKILADFCGLECQYVSGYCGNDPQTGGHAWNLVKVDGQYYQLDVTWNDGGGKADRQTYFLVTDDFMSLSRHWKRENYPASAKTPYKKH